MKFESHGYEYQIDEFGVIHQVDPQPYTYNSTYVATYDTEAYKRQSDILQALRLGFTLGAHGRKINSLLDFGYGNGAFMLFAKQHILNVYGYDISGVSVEGCYTSDKLPELKMDVITFWDALEHVHDLSFVRDLNCETVVISLPFCHFDPQGVEWFSNEYKHRKPNEHVHHFNEQSLAKMMLSYGWHKIAFSTHEDIVRKSAHGLDNILTMAFKR